MGLSSRAGLRSCGDRVVLAGFAPFDGSEFRRGNSASPSTHSQPYVISDLRQSPPVISGYYCFIGAESVAVARPYAGWTVFRLSITNG
jgi:hypothetical protein